LFQGGGKGNLTCPPLIPSHPPRGLLRLYFDFSWLLFLVGSVGTLNGARRPPYQMATHPNPPQKTPSLWKPVPCFLSVDSCCPQLGGGRAPYLPAFVVGSHFSGLASIVLTYLSSLGHPVPWWLPILGGFCTRALAPDSARWCFPRRKFSFGSKFIPTQPS